MRIREARFPDDRPVALAFIEALQRFERAFEPNRRLDDSYAVEHLEALLADAAEGRVLIAEDEDGAPLGWAVVHEEKGPVFVIDDERNFANLAELFVDAAARGKGVGSALIDACEDWARGRGLTTIRISHLERNTSAARAYEKAGYTPYSVQQRKRL